MLSPLGPPRFTLGRPTHQVGPRGPAPRRAGGGLVDQVLLGRSGRSVSRLGFGLAAVGRPGYIALHHGRDLVDTGVRGMEANARRLLDRAFAGGVRYFDLARSYGRAEAFLASWLAERGLRAEEVTIGSKWGYTYTGEWRVDAEVHEVKEHSLRRLLSQWRESRELLGGHLDLYQVHSATLASGVLDDLEVCSALADIRESSGVAIGLSLSGPEQGAVLERALGVEVGGRPLFDTVQATWNPLEPSVAPALREAHRAGLGVIVKEALANGRLTGRNTAPEFGGVLSSLAREASRLGTSISGLALAAALAQPWADVVLSGAVTTEQLEDNLEAVAVGIDAEALESLKALAEPPATYWRIRSALPWT